MKNFEDHVKQNTCAVNLQHIDEYEFVQGMFLLYCFDAIQNKFLVKFRYWYDSALRDQPEVGVEWVG